MPEIDGEVEFGRNPDLDLVGKRVEFVSTTDPLAKLQPGTLGTVRRVDSEGTIHVSWDDGGSLGLIRGEDHWKVVDR